MLFFLTVNMHHFYLYLRTCGCSDILNFFCVFVLLLHFKCHERLCFWWGTKIQYSMRMLTVPVLGINTVYLMGNGNTIDFLPFYVYDFRVCYSIHQVPLIQHLLLKGKDLLPRENILLSVKSRSKGREKVSLYLPPLWLYPFPPKKLVHAVRMIHSRW